MGFIEIFMLATLLASGIGVTIWITVMAFLFLEELSKVLSTSDD